MAAFHLDGTLASAAQLAGDPTTAALDPVPALPDCTPDASSPIQYPPALALDATLAQDPAGSGAALCRTNGVVYSGERTGASSYLVSAQADPAVLCSGACAATLEVVIAGDVAVDAGGAPAAFRGILVEVLTASHGACDACLPLVPGVDPPARACAGRYALTGAVR